MTRPWPRPLLERGGDAATFELYVLCDAPPTGVIVDLVAEGSPWESLPDGVSLGGLERELDPAAYDEWVEGLARRAPEEALAARIEASTYVHVVTVDVPDPQDLGYLQAAWAVTRGALRAGAFAAFDARADRWWSRDEALSLPAADNRPACAWSLRIAPVPELGADVHLAYSHGLVKFGRRDLVAVLPPARRAEAEVALAELAHGQLLGRVLRSGDRLVVAGVRVALDAYAPGFNGPPVDLPTDLQPLFVSFPS